MYALFVLSVHVYYVNCNAKTQMGYLCTLIKKKKKIPEDAIRQPFPPPATTPYL